MGADSIGMNQESLPFAATPSGSITGRTMQEMLGTFSSCSSTTGAPASPPRLAARSTLQR